MPPTDTLAREGGVLHVAGGLTVNDAESWRWLWLVATFLFAVGEILTPGSFVLLPFALGALLATLLSFAGVHAAVTWLVFIVASVVGLFALRPVARRLDVNAQDEGIGSRRLVGQDATVLQRIPERGELGLVRIGREEWRAASTTGEAVPAGTVCRVADVQGTHVVVAVTETLLPGDEVRR
jgi:membrane protein implicated in regulation of membrane protease activity